MIPVKKQEKPATFDVKVKTPGEKYLEAQKIGKTDQAPKKFWAGHAYWTQVLPDLIDKYQVCAYCCFIVHSANGSATVDHFLPKKEYPWKAYDWDNFRLACFGSNRGKRGKTLDPIGLTEDTFFLNFLDFSVMANPKSSQKQNANATVRTLKLNNPDLVKWRKELWEEYEKGELTEAYLRKTNPFIWYEAQRQNLLPLPPRGDRL